MLLSDQFTGVLPYRLSGTLTPRFCTVILFAVAGSKKCSTIYARDQLHIVSPDLNQMLESKKLYGLFNF